MTIEDFEVGTYVLFSDGGCIWLCYGDDVNRIDRWVILTDHYCSNMYDVRGYSNDFLERNCSEWILLKVYKELPEEFMI